MTSHAGELVCAFMALGGLLALLITVLVSNYRDRRAAREARKRDRLHRIGQIGFRSALMRGLVDERGNVIERVGYQDDIR